MLPVRYERLQAFRVRIVPIRSLLLRRHSVRNSGMLALERISGEHYRGIRLFI